MFDIHDYLLRSLELFESKAAGAASPGLRKAYLDLADHYRSRLKNAPSLIKA
jgi:hypothetical protein